MRKGTYDMMTPLDEVPPDTADRCARAVEAVRKIHRLALGSLTQSEAGVVLERAVAEFGAVIAYHGLAREQYAELLVDAGNRPRPMAPAPNGRGA